MKKNILNFCGLCAALLLSAPVIWAQNPVQRQIEAWITNPDRSSVFEKVSQKFEFTDKTDKGTPIVVDDKQIFQTIDGFGFALTGGSAEHLMKMSAEARSAILHELFATDGNNMGISYLRLSIGASDLNSFVFSYDDLPEGETDFALEKFDLAQDKKDVIPVMKEILAIQPDILILGSPWSAPTWMKTNGKVKGGALKPECYEVYAKYFVKYIQAMKKEGITIDAITVQNEPLNSGNTPSLQMLPQEQNDFIKKYVGPAFKAAGLKTKIILFDHNLDRIDHPLTALRDPETSRYVDGSAFHHYAGDFSAMNALHYARPDKNLYFTEQMITETPGKPFINIAASVKRLIIGATRNWSRNVILWNLAADALNDPHTNNGGCSMCQGAITIEGDKVARNLAYYTVAHASKFVRPGSVRIFSTSQTDPSVILSNDEEKAGALRVWVTETSDVLPNVAYKTPDGKIVLIVVNDTAVTNSFKIQYNGQYATIPLKPGAVGTFVW
ncbi:MAG: glycoside hydrolase family 30 beta sandwich domain-containing protein [Bacteroidales bacterium]|nr:glycoside hydrolase family 30 beta sandwich domain-containing protein [Bacteroidales bacterium]